MRTVRVPHVTSIRTKASSTLKMGTKRADGTALGCEACHNRANWKALTRYDHSKTTFPLLGAHRGVACKDCHQPPAQEMTLKNVDFQTASKQCLGCHQDPHAGQFATRRDAADCSGCHDSARWKPARFDHDKRTPFPLAGAHQNVACGQCHKLRREVRGQSVILYKPTPRECKACHG